MFRFTRAVCYSLFAAILATSAVAAASSKSFKGNWISDLYYQGTTYTLELSIAEVNDDGKLSGSLKVLDAGYLVETLGLRSVELAGDSLVVQTDAIDGRAARFSLVSGENELSGLFWETSYSGEARGEGLKMVFKQKKKE